MKKEQNIENLNKIIENERILNKVLMGENVELKKINVGLKEAYDSIIEERKKYEKFFPIIDKIKTSVLYRGLKKVKRTIKRGNYE